MGIFAEVEGLQDYIGVEIPDDKLATAGRCLQAATDAIKLTSRRVHELVLEDVIELHPQGQPITIRLPETPVWWVSRIILALVPGVAQGVIVTNFEVTRWGRIRWPLGDFSSTIAAAINAPTLEVEWAPLAVVTYTHGYLLDGQDPPELPDGATPTLSFSEVEPIPSELQSICLAAASRAFLNPEGMAAETEGTSSSTYGDARGVTLTAEEKGQLLRWRERSWGGS